MISDEIIKANKTLYEKRKIELILISKSTTAHSILARYMLQIFIKHEYEKRFKWSTPRHVLSYDMQYHTVTILGSNVIKNLLLLKTLEL